MAILAIFTGNNVTKQMYEALRKEVDWEHNHPAGSVRCFEEATERDRRK
jgi:hypothetical protein